MEVHVLQAEGAVSGMVSGIFRKFGSIDFNRRHDVEKCIRLVCEKLRVFSYAQYTVEFCVKFPFLWCSQVKIEVGIEEKYMCKNVSKQTRVLITMRARRPCFSIDLDRTVNMLGLCDPSNLLLVLSPRSDALLSNYFEDLLNVYWKIYYPQRCIQTLKINAYFPLNSLHNAVISNC